jgi:hypothetical protein
MNRPEKIANNQLFQTTKAALIKSNIGIQFEVNFFKIK